MNDILVVLLCLSVAINFCFLYLLAKKFEYEEDVREEVERKKRNEEHEKNLKKLDSFIAYLEMANKDMEKLIKQDMERMEKQKRGL